MEPSTVRLANTACEEPSLDSSATNISSTTADICPDNGAASQRETAAAVIVTTAGQDHISRPNGASSTPLRGGSNGGYTEVSASGTAQAGHLAQSPKEQAKEPSASASDEPDVKPLDASTTTSPEELDQKFSLQGSSISNLLERTGYPIVQQNGQRRYGPPPDWDGTPPPRGSEVFVGKIPRDCFEDELVPVFETVGTIYEIRLMMDHFSELNRGYAFVVFTTAGEAKECVKQLNNYEIRQGRTLGICMSVDNCRLFIGGIPKKVTKEDIIQEMMKVTEGVVDVIVYPSASDKTKNRGFAFVEYDSHRSAAMARRKLINGRIQLWGHNIAVDWAEPELEVDEEIMSQVKVLYVRNLMLTTTEAQIEEAFSAHAPVERVKKIKDYAFVHFGTKQHAHLAMEAMNASVLDGAQIEVTLAKPVDKDSYMRSPKYNRQLSVPAFYVPVDQFGSILPFYPSYYSPPKYMLRNSMGACAMVRMGRSSRSTRGTRGSFYPVSYTNPPPRYVYQTSPPLASGSAATASPQFFPTTPTAAFFDAAGAAKRPGEEQLGVPALVDMSQHPSAAVAIKSAKNSVQTLEEICQKCNWGQPIFTLHSTAGTSPDEDTLYLYKVMVPGLSMTYIPAKLTRSIDEAKTIAADYSLVQLGYPMEASFSQPRALHYPEIPLCAANFVAVQQNSPKPAMGTWATLGAVDPATAHVAAATAMYPATTYTPENPFPAPQGFAAHPQEFYQQGF